MLNLFKKNLFVNILLLIPFTFLLRVSVGLYVNMPITDNHSVIFNSLFGGLPKLSLFQIFSSTVIILSQAYSLNFIVNRNRLNHELNMWTALVFVVLVSCFPINYSVQPVIVGNYFIIWVIYNVFYTDRLTHFTVEIFNSSFWTIIASYFYWPFIYLLIPVLFGNLILRTFQVKEAIQFLSGIFTAYYLTWVIWYLIEPSSTFSEFINYQPFKFTYSQIFDHSWLSALLTALGSIYFFINSFSIKKKKTSLIHNKYNFFFVYLFTCLLIFLLNPGIQESFYIIPMVAFSVFLPSILALSKNNLARELIFYSLLLIAIMQGINFKAILNNYF